LSSICNPIFLILSFFAFASISTSYKFLLASFKSFFSLLNINSPAPKAPTPINKDGINPTDNPK